MNIHCHIRLKLGFAFLIMPLSAEAVPADSIVPLHPDMITLRMYSAITADEDAASQLQDILPGCGYTRYWYDRGNRMTFMQDAALRERGLYRFFLYDRLGRLAVQGTCAACDRGGRPNVAEFSEKDAGICNTGYNIPLSDKITNPYLEIVNYYDSYGFIGHYAPIFGNAVALSANKYSSFGFTDGMEIRHTYLLYSPVFHYFMQDHLGNNHVVTN